jgi:serine/threonine protein kinase
MANHFEDSFELGRKLGEGASACVFECKSKKDGKIYAVKISRGDVELLRISKRTFKIMKRLNHPNILKAKCLYLNQVS